MTTGGLLTLSGQIAAQFGIDRPSWQPKYRTKVLPRNKVNRWKVIIPIALIIAGIAIITYPDVGVVLIAIGVVAICWINFPLIVSKFNEWLKIDREIWDLRLAIVLKIVQIGAFFAAGFWVSYNAYLLHKKEAARSATYGCVATTTLRVDPIPGGDGQKSLYLVTVDTLVRNDTDRLVSISDYRLDFYVGKTLAGPSPGFFVPPPTLKLGHPTIDWKHFGRMHSNLLTKSLSDRYTITRNPRRMPNRWQIQMNLAVD